MIGARISMGFANFFSTDSFMGCLLSLAMVRWYIPVSYTHLDVYKRQIYDHPLTRFVAGFIGESNIFDGTVTAVEGDLLRVDTPAGKLLTRGSGFAVGEEMHVSIRPEYLEAGERSADGFDLPARIKDFTYMGTVVKTALDMADGTEQMCIRDRP